MSLRYLILISGIFGKSEEIDILPPPPPFPEIEEEEEEKAGKVEIIKEIEIKEKKEEQEKRRTDRERKAEEKRNEKLVQEKKKARKKKTFEFFHGLGLVKTEKEKEEYLKQKLEYKKQKDLAKKNIGRERRSREIEKQREKALDIKRKVEEERKKRKEIERQQREAEKMKQTELELGKREDEEKQKLVGEIPEKKPFSRSFGKKDSDLELERELKEIEEIAKKEPKKEKLEVTEIEEAVKPGEIEKSQEEIQEAIQGMKAKRPSIVKGWFRKKDEVEEKIEMPEVMPRTYDKIDYIELIEEKIHKARLYLMDFKFDEAKYVYTEIMKMYFELEPKKKAKVYQDIKDLYYEREGAEKFAR